MGEVFKTRGTVYFGQNHVNQPQLIIDILFKDSF